MVVGGNSTVMRVSQQILWYSYWSPQWPYPPLDNRIPEFTSKVLLAKHQRNDARYGHCLKRIGKWSRITFMVIWQTYMMTQHPQRRFVTPFEVLLLYLSNDVRNRAVWITLTCVVITSLTVWSWSSPSTHSYFTLALVGQVNSCYPFVFVGKFRKWQRCMDNRY